ncbi:MAG: hypothetical protein GY851_32210 [bacterium]|nr:hypothetical protein [bacterium]
MPNRQSRDTAPRRARVETPVSFRTWRRASRLLRAVATNLIDEFRFASRGVRRLDLWRDDPVFLDLCNEMHDRTLISPARLFSLYQLALSALPLPGDVAELGVYRGGSARLLARVFAGHAPDKRVMLFDTFEGLPSHDTDRDAHRQGDLAGTSFDEVRTFLSDCANVEFRRGLFSETLPSVAGQRFCYVHVDADLYASVQECCEFFLPRLVTCGVLVFDDYGFLSCPGARQAVDEFFADKPETPLYLTTGQCLVRKLPS